ncbi:MAG TPA: alanine racemase [Amphiplicatus sp.]|nr:alanine racemase [Amphiplicatus sp.]
MGDAMPSPYPDFPASTPAVEIDLDAVRANFRTLKSAAPAAEISAVVKCDAYGLGAMAVARTLAAFEQCRTFFVAYPHEGVDLRSALGDLAPNAKIYIFNGPSAETLGAFEEGALTPVINSREQARLWAGARPGAIAALHVDTGMNRLGANERELSDIAATRGLKIGLVMSHLACGFDPGHDMNRRQHLAFEKACAEFPGVKRSLSASAGAFMGPAYHYDLIRPGIAIYGAGPFDRPDPRLKPVARLVAPVVQLRQAKAGESAGYGAACTFRKDARLATVALGYGDGFLRTGSEKGAAFVGGALCPIAGRISMDLIILDVTNAPQPIEIGDKAEFFGPQHPIEDAAEAAGTIAYELLTGLGARLHRRYLLDGRPVEPDAVGAAA